MDGAGKKETRCEAAAVGAREGGRGGGSVMDAFGRRVPGAMHSRKEPWTKVEAPTGSGMRGYRAGTGVEGRARRFLEGRAGSAGEPR